jgi:hypothetical protein
VRGVEIVIKEGVVVEPFSVVFDAAGNLYGVEFTKTNRVFKQSVAGEVTFIAGVKCHTDEKKLLPELGDGPAATAQFHGLHDLCFADGNDMNGGKVLLLADTFHHCIRRLDLATGIVSTVVGTGHPGYNGNNHVAASADLNVPICIAPTPQAGQFLITDLANQRVRIYDARTGTVADAVGNGKKGAVQNGAAPTGSALAGPRAAVADAGGMWLLLREGNALVRVADHHLHTILNAAGKPGYSEGPTMLDVQLNGPKYLCLDAVENPIFCDTENHVVRRYLPKEKKVELLVGVPGKPGNALGSTGLTTQLRRPHGVRIHDGWLYVADSENNRVLRVPYR